MKMMITGLALAILASNASAAPPRLKIGQCVESRLGQIGSRLEGDPDSGSSLTFLNGVHQVSYDPLPAAQSAHVGDMVRLCVVDYDQTCKVADGRGFTYRATDLRTHSTWSAADSEHKCSGE